MSAKHTPGRWMRSGGGFIYANDGEHHRFVAEVNGNRPEADANARLIETAPELLESCKELLADSHGHTGDCAVWIQDEDGAVISYQAEECDCEFGAKRSRARAAIAKAEGRS